MPIRTSPPPTPAKATADRFVAKASADYTKTVYKTALAWLAVMHFVVACLFAGGVEGYALSWRRLILFTRDHPMVVVFILAGFYLLRRGVELWREPDNAAFVLPPYPPVPDLRMTDDLYLGSAQTRKGKQPGEMWDPTVDTDDELLLDRPHVIVPPKTLFANLHVLGGIGSGKTSSFILPVADQAIAKYPLPLPPERFTLGTDGRYLDANPVTTPGTRLKALAGRLRLTPPAPPREPSITDWHPYAGMDIDEASAEYERLKEQHYKKKWGLFIIDAKGDLTDDVRRKAALYGRSQDVVVLEPGGPNTYNALAANSNSLVMAELVMDGFDAVQETPVPGFWRNTMSEWLANTLSVLRHVEPTRVTFKNILRMARNDTLRASLVSEAEALMRETQEAEASLKRMGQPYHGVRVDPAVIEFFKEWDDPDNSDPKMKQAILSGIKSQARSFVDAEMAPFLCPEMLPTFEGGFEEMIDKGKIVILRVPLDKYANVGRILGILVLADAQQAAKRRLNSPDMNQERVGVFLIDEIANYLNSLTTQFVSVNRQSRVSFMGAHQSLDQIPKAYAGSFSNNLRTKISFGAPNAQAAADLVKIFGGRRVWKERRSENLSFSGVEHVADADIYAADGKRSAGVSLSVEDVERAWFDPEEFVALDTGQAIISEFDGSKTLPPRKIHAPADHLSPSGIRAKEIPLETRYQAPHPYILIEDITQHPASRDHEYLSAAFEQSGFVLITPLADAHGDIQGFKFVTDVGTLVAPCATLEALSEVLADRMADPQTVFVFTDLTNGTRYFAGTLGVTCGRALGFVDAYADLFPAALEKTYADIFARETTVSLCADGLGSWEYYAQRTNHDAIVAESRLALELYATLGRAILDAEGEERLDQLTTAAAARMHALLADADDEPASAPLGALGDGRPRADDDDDDPDGPDGPDGPGGPEGPGGPGGGAPPAPPVPPAPGPAGAAPADAEDDVWAPFAPAANDPYAGSSYPDSFPDAPADPEPPKPAARGPIRVANARRAHVEPAVPDEDESAPTAWHPAADTPLLAEPGPGPALTPDRQPDVPAAPQSSPTDVTPSTAARSTDAAADDAATVPAGSTGAGTDSGAPDSGDAAGTARPARRRKPGTTRRTSRRRDDSLPLPFGEAADARTAGDAPGDGAGGADDVDDIRSGAPD